ncbi:MAG: hypothetical protein Q9173_001592 [Seirophora scorigena]
MGQEVSTPISDSTPSRTLSARTVEAVASYIKEGRARKIVVMTGAGISTAAGIPDFRSPKTGVYSNLAKLNLPRPEAVFDISYFCSNPLPFYTLAHELDPSRYKPTLSHCFVRLLSNKGLLLKLFTQNIDCLERAAGVPHEKIVEAHGSFASQRCIECRQGFPDDLMKQAITKREIPRCTQATCNGLVKPDIVFFGEALPEDFHRNRTLPAAADLVIVMGTSLRVQPFASLPGCCREGVPRLLVNSERVGGLGSRADDVLLLGDCDEGIRKLALAIGWLEELEALFEKYHQIRTPEEKSHVPETQDDKLEDEIAQITRDIDDALRISRHHAVDLQQSVSLPTAEAPQRSASSLEEIAQDQPSTVVRRSHTESQGSNGQSSQREATNESLVGGEQMDKKDSTN